MRRTDVSYWSARILYESWRSSTQRETRHNAGRLFRRSIGCSRGTVSIFREKKFPKNTGCTASRRSIGSSDLAPTHESENALDDDAAGSECPACCPRALEKTSEQHSADSSRA